MSKTKVTVFGAAGRMGRKLVAQVAAAADLELVGAIESAGNPTIGSDAGELAGIGRAGVAVTADWEALAPQSDAVIIFSTAGVIEAVRTAVKNHCACVIGTTALSTEVKAELAELAAKGAKIVQSPNMSVGVNLLFHLTAEAARLLGEDYDVEIVEMHHNQKKDAPSGTAAKLAEVVCKTLDRNYENDVRHGRVGMVGARTRREIGMHSLRGGDVVGDHTVIFATGGERVELTHKASSRDTFAGGAIRAVRFLADAPGGKVYDMMDVLHLR